MVEGIQLKICGLTTLVDAELADRSGADFLGFILYPKSPRYISLSQYSGMATRLPNRRRVAVSVDPSVDELGAMADAGFDFFQIHFREETEAARIMAWAQTVGRERLWLAPKLPPEIAVPDRVRSAAQFVLLDTFQATGYGGSGQTGDWRKFSRHRAAYPENTWILAGGLGAENIGAALVQSGARIVDVNSGVESSPGIKDPAKLQSLVAAMRHAAASRR